MSIVIGLTGAKGSGKDQFFRAARRGLANMDIRQIAFADPIKHQIQQIFRLRDEREYDEFKRSSIQYDTGGGAGRLVEGRRIVREIGMLMRSYNSNQFVEYVEREIKLAPAAIWCITDVRFQNEVDLVTRSLNGILIKIRRTGHEYDGHVTETEIPDSACSTVIYNDNVSLDEYNDRVVDVVRSILQTLSVN